jgi:hypothetical protein
MAMKMTLLEAKEECANWFAHWQAQEDRATDLQKLAADRRAGRCNEEEGRRRRLAIQGNGLLVYDGSNLRDAVKVLLLAVDGKS